MFNTIYVEEKAYEYPITKQLLEKYNDSTVIPIRHYKDVFNRPKQHHIIQKKNPSLILAVKDGQLIYKGPEICQDFSHTNFYYTSFLLNCLFDCEYCFLQGMYPSSYIVAFLNVEDFQNAIEKAACEKQIYLVISYDTDLIAFHNVIPYMEYFYDFFENHSNVLVEIRTKSANQAFYTKYPPLDNIITAFSLAPNEIIKRYEQNTPPLEARIKAIKTAMKNGFKVRICFDPVFAHQDLGDVYKEFFDYIFTQIDPDGLLDVGYGFFRMSRDYFKRIEKIRTNSLLFAEEYCIKDNTISYPEPIMEKIKKEHFEILTKYIKKEKIFAL